MKTFTKLALATLVACAAALPAAAAEYTKGEVTKVDEKAKKVTIKHEELRNLEMPAMTMVFVVPDEATFKKASVGKKIEFVAEKVKGKMTVVEIK
ncbi:copper-binding protein [Aureimonas psammosilenae]|uniref:copper-binding protein n=1 Tax=Aureimonas psammosilenae TaxID=2495496 RepID=UPI00126080B6|nr:copper-binding protein [Aureimonas psammosilenae]